MRPAERSRGLGPSSRSHTTGIVINETHATLFSLLLLLVLLLFSCFTTLPSPLIFFLLLCPFPFLFRPSFSLMFFFGACPTQKETRIQPYSMVRAHVGRMYPIRIKLYVYVYIYIYIGYCICKRIRERETRIDFYGHGAVPYGV